MNEKLRKLYLEMISFDHADPALIQHFTKVHAYASLIARCEGLNADTLETLEAAALVHDIAIPLCRAKYGSDAGELQEKEGPALVENMLPALGFSRETTERVKWLVAHHHTYKIEGIDHQILVEADFLVNAFEGAHSLDAKKSTLQKIFKTPTGTKIFAEMFGL